MAGLGLRLLQRLLLRGMVCPYSVTVCRPSWTLETVPDVYFSQGGLLAAGISYATANYQSTWAWRAPSLVQGVFSVICVLIIPFVPESPRWLVFNGRMEEAGKVLALTHSDGNEADAVVLAQLNQIVETIEYEKNAGATLSMEQMVKTPSARKRVLLAISVAVFSTICGTFDYRSLPEQKG
jgi:Sugar (and other) transporter